MLCQQYSKHIPLLEKSIEQSYGHMVQVEKFEDARRMLDQCEGLFGRMAEEQDEKQSNLPLFMLIQTLNLLMAKQCLLESQMVGSREEEQALVDRVIGYLDANEELVQKYGLRESHILLTLDISKSLFLQIEKQLSPEADVI